MLQVIQCVINDPDTSGRLLNDVVDLILETGNFSTEHEAFQFDICNLDLGTVGKIETILQHQQVR